MASLRSQRRRWRRIKGVTSPARLLKQSSSCSALSSLQLPSKHPQAPSGAPPIQEKQTGHFNFVNLTCKQHDRAKSPTSPPVSWGLFMCMCVCVCAGVCVHACGCGKGDSTHTRKRNSTHVFVYVCKNILECQRVCDGEIA